MASKMRAVFSVGVCLLVAISSVADADEHKETGQTPTGKGWCVLNGGVAINDALDAAVYAWAASRRCAKWKQGNIVKCEMDIASAAESTNRMVNVIINAVESCNVAKADKCGKAVGKLTAHFAGVAAASGGIVQECPNPLAKKHNLVQRDSLRKHGAGMSLADPVWPEGEQATCVVDIKNTMRQIFAASAAITKAAKNCDDSGKCVYDSFEILSAFAGLGKYVMGSLGHCSSAQHLLKNFPLTCSEHIAGLTRSVAGFAGDTDELIQACHHPVNGSGFVAPSIPGPTEVIIIPEPAPRLYAQDKEKALQTDASPANNVLLALLPITAFVSFMVGRRVSRHQDQRSYKGMLTMEEMEGGGECTE